MVKFLTTNGASYYLEQIITSAEKELVLITPYLKLSKTFFERLIDADMRKVKIHVIYGKEELRNSELEKLDSLENLTLYYFENLHAKCYYNDDMMVITSMNLHEFSEKRNREMGVLIKRDDESEIFQKAIQETNSIMVNSNVQLTPEPPVIETSVTEENEVEYSLIPDNLPTQGYCIRCGTDVRYDPSRPLCNKCYAIWSEYFNEDYPEKFCHSCATKEITSYAKPECITCYKNNWN